MSSVADRIETLRKEARQRTDEANGLERLLSKFPDLEININRWQRVRCSSPSANGFVTRFDIGHNCGCCSDSPLEVWPYLETDDGRVYSKPARFVVGEKDPTFYVDRPYTGWDAKMGEAGIPKSIIDAVRAHFKAQADEVRKTAVGFADEIDPDRFEYEENDDET